jgi:hypothetical protein
MSEARIEQTGPLPVAGGGSVTAVRPLLLLMYLFFTAAGLACMFAPSRAVAGQVAPWMTLVWAGFFLVGGIFCFVGAVGQRWAGELLGLPLIAASALIYGSALLISYSDPSRRDGAYLFVGALLVAQALSIVERWVTKLRLFRVAQRITDREAG